MKYQNVCAQLWFTWDIASSDFVGICTKIVKRNPYGESPMSVCLSVCNILVSGIGHTDTEPSQMTVSLGGLAS